MENYTYVNIDTTKVKEYMELNGYNMSSLSKLLGYSDGYIYNCLQSGKMAADAYKTMCNLLGTDDNILTTDDENNMYHTGTKVATGTTVKFKSAALKKYLKEIRMSMESLSTKMGYTYNYVGSCVKNGKMNEDSYDKMCEILRIGKSKFMKYEYEYKPKPKTDKPKTEKSAKSRLTEETKELMPKKEESKKEDKEVKPIGYSQLVMTDADGKSHVKLLIDKEEFDDLNNQLSDLLNLMDSAFSQISQLQLKLNELTSKNN